MKKKKKKKEKEREKEEKEEKEEEDEEEKEKEAKEDKIFPWHGGSWQAHRRLTLACFFTGTIQYSQFFHIILMQISLMDSSIHHRSYSTNDTIITFFFAPSLFLPVSTDLYLPWLLLVRLQNRGLPAVKHDHRILIMSLY